MSIADKLTTIADNMQKVFEAGKSADYDTFWDTFQENGNRNSYNYGFARAWTDDIYNPKYPILCSANTYSAEGLFSDSKITDTKVPITIRGIRADSIFQDCAKLKRIPSLTLENITRFTNNSFRGCKVLEELNLYGEINVDGLNLSQSPLLTHDSLMSVINALKDFSTPRNVLQNDPLTLTDYTPSIMDIYELVEGKTYITNYWTEETDTFFDNVEQKAHKVYVEGYGEKIGVHYSADYWVYPDDYTFNLIIFNGDIDEGTGEPFIQEYRYLQNKTTGEITLMGAERNGDKISVYTKGGDGTHTVTLGEENLAKLTDAEKIQATEKGWELK